MLIHSDKIKIEQLNLQLIRKITCLRLKNIFINNYVGCTSAIEYKVPAKAAANGINKVVMKK
jgi:hypothetical protein